MDRVKFKGFCFDLNTLSLNKNATTVLLRPKTALLLKILIENRASVMDKRSLVYSVWGTEHVSDQSLFQAISELRQKVAPLTPIKTFPNRGYQWVEPVTTVSMRLNRYKPAAIAASIFVMSLLLVSGGLSADKPSDQKQVQVSAALSAFVQGVALLQSGDTQAAEQMLRLSTQENPLLNEAQLLLAEVSLQQGDALTARSQALQLLQDSSRVVDSYTIVSAMDVVSRSESKLGKNNAALKWAAEALRTANSEGFVCTAYDLQDRLAALEDSGLSTMTQPLADQSELKVITTARTTAEISSATLAGLSGFESDANKNNHKPLHCDQIRGNDPEIGWHFAPDSQSTKKLAVVNTINRSRGKVNLNSMI